MATTKRRLARLLFWGALCVAFVTEGAEAVAAPASAYAPPPPIPLDAAPPPELAPLEYPRRPFELSPEFALALPTCADDGVSDAHCGGLRSSFGLAALWRATPFIALGGSANQVPLDRGSHHAFYGVLGRLYLSDHGIVDPYLELGLGLGNATSRNAAARAGGGVEFFLGRHVRLGPAFDWTAIRADTDVIAFSLRLSLLIGPGS